MIIKSGSNDLLTTDGKLNCVEELVVSGLEKKTIAEMGKKTETMDQLSNTGKDNCKRTVKSPTGTTIKFPNEAIRIAMEKKMADREKFYRKQLEEEEKASNSHQNLNENSNNESIDHLDLSKKNSEDNITAPVGNDFTKCLKENSVNRDLLGKRDFTGCSMLLEDSFNTKSEEVSPVHVLTKVRLSSDMRSTFFEAKKIDKQSPNLISENRKILKDNQIQKIRIICDMVTISFPY